MRQLIRFDVHLLRRDAPSGTTLPTPLVPVVPANDNRETGGTMARSDPNHPMAPLYHPDHAKLARSGIDQSFESRLVKIEAPEVIRFESEGRGRDLRNHEQRAGMAPAHSRHR